MTIEKDQSEKHTTLPAEVTEKTEKNVALTTKETVSSKDLRLLNDLHAALQEEKHTGLFAVIWL